MGGGFFREGLFPYPHPVNRDTCAAGDGSGGRIRETVKYEFGNQNESEGVEVVWLNRLSVGCVTTPRRQSGDFAGF